MKYLIILLSLLGCSDPSLDHAPLSYTYCLENVPERHVAFIQAAMDEWNSKTGVTTLSVGVGADCNASIKLTDYVGTKDEDAANSLVALRQIQYEYDIENDAIRVVMLHELGHMLGLEHSLNQHDIMFYNAFASDGHITKNDLAAFRKYWWLD